MTTAAEARALTKLAKLAEQARTAVAKAEAATAARDAAMLACADLPGVRVQDVADAVVVTKDRVGQVLRAERKRRALQGTDAAFS